ncbi:aldehyde dehydrogenase family protein [Zobellella maritima]|uniref:aldehyde dehydrogenase family protein n=1 Tax=Zobellella maritima TaxID=2059725 RepID=UPI000E300FBB|nr:aldehyde dehydrogenase family protein [Zobellella maritima]
MTQFTDTRLFPNFSQFFDGHASQGEGASLTVVNPATGEQLTSCRAASQVQLERAISSARQAFRVWRDSTHQERSNLLNEIADTMATHEEELARLITLEQGKPLTLARFEVQGAIAWTRYTAGLDLPVSVLEQSPQRRVELQRKPLGVVASIPPWNWPLLICIWHIMPAVRAGNAVVCKPSSLTPLTTLRLFELINKIAPPGLFNIVTGSGGELGRALSEHKDIAKLVFTGSTGVGQDIMARSGANLKRLTLELGGNDAGIVLPDAQPAQIAAALFQGAFINMGQTCAALKRLYVPDALYDELCDLLWEQAKAQHVGDGMEEAVNFGPVQNAHQLKFVQTLLSAAKNEGATVLDGGQPLPAQGFFMAPTLVRDIAYDSRLVLEEQFGPVLPIVRYSTLEQAIEWANACEFGLGGSVWGTDPEQLRLVADQLDCGTVWINGHAEVLPHVPFGGSKMSGIGCEFGLEGLLEYTQMQAVNIRGE